MITSVLDKSKMDGMLIPHFYPLFTDDIEYSTYLNEMIQKYRGSEAENLKKGTTWMSGWVTAEILTETVRLAAETVGGKNVDGNAINDAFQALDITIGNMPAITLAARGGNNVLQPYSRMIQYKAAADDWYAAISDWRIAPGRNLGASRMGVAEMDGRETTSGVCTIGQSATALASERKAPLPPAVMS